MWFDFLAYCSTQKLLFLCGGLVMMAFYHFGLYFMRRKELSTLFFALFCLIIAVRASATEEIILLILFPGLSWELLYVLLYLSFYLAVPIFIHFIYLLFPADVWRRLVPLSWITAILFSISVIAAPAKVYSTFTPMSGLTGMAELLLDEPLSADQKEYAAAIQDSSEMLLAIINDILDFSKIEEGKLALDEVDFDLRFVEKSVTGLIGPKAREKGLRFASSFDPEVPRALRGDPLRLGQVLLNLLGNAVKFTEQGEVSLRVSLESMDGGSTTIRFEVRDTGPGVPESAGENLFDPFTQADASTTRKYGGTGLGLSICKRLVELMNGRIGFESEEGRGTTFWFTLPFALGSTADLPVADAVSPGARLLSLHEGSDPILVAKDFAINRMLIVAQLKKLGLDANVVENGREAVEAATRKRYAMILMDCRMPEMDGFKATRAIRDLEKRHGGRILMLIPNTTNSTCSSTGEWFPYPGRLFRPQHPQKPCVTASLPTISICYICVPSRVCKECNKNQTTVKVPFSFR